MTNLANRAQGCLLGRATHRLKPLPRLDLLPALQVDGPLL